MVDKQWWNTKIFYDLSKTHRYHNIVIVRLPKLTQICIFIIHNVTCRRVRPSCTTYTIRPCVNARFFGIPTIILSFRMRLFRVLKFTIYIRHTHTHTHTSVSNNDLPGIINGKYVPYTHYNILHCAAAALGSRDI